jgi:hypothetical protein
MAIMKVTRTLRDAPGGNSTGKSAPAGIKVQVLDASTPPWIKIQVIGLPDQPVGFVSDDAVDNAADATLGPLDKALFAKECARQENIYGVSAHYLMAVAGLRTNVTDGPRAGGSGDIGPFALSSAEWKFFGTMPEFQLDFADSDINFWRNQCAVFAVMTYISQNKLAGLLGAQPAPTELYFAQLVGTKAAITGVHNPSQAIDALINATSQSDFQADGIDSTRIVARSAGLLKNGTSVKDTLLDAIASKLQKSLDDTRPFMVSVGAQPIQDSGSTLPSGKGGGAGINFDAPVIAKTHHKDMAMLIAQRFGEAGFGTIHQITAIASAIGESSLNPTLKSPDPEKSFGLFQLNQAKGARGFGHSAAELRDPERNIAITLDWFAKDRTLAPFKTASDLRAAVTIFVRDFENPRDKQGEINRRFKIAQSIIA